MHDYNIGDTIAYTPFGGGERIVLVDEKEDDIKNGMPGFGGRLVGGDASMAGFGDVWGYDHQITRVVSRA